MARAIKPTAVQEQSMGEHAYVLDKEINSLHFDLEALAWGCERLFDHEARTNDAEASFMVGRCSVAVIRMLAQRTGPLLIHTEKLYGALADE